MKTIGFMRMLSGVAVVSSILFGGVPASASVLELTKKVAGMTVHYKVVLPDGYDATKAYPAILAFGGGPQTMNTVDGILNRNFQDRGREARLHRRGAGRARRRAVLRRRRADLSGLPEDDPCGLQDSGREVSHRGRIQWRHRCAPHRGCQSAIFPLGHRVPRIFVGTDAGQASGDLEDVRLHVCRRKRRVPLARRDAKPRWSSCARREPSRATPSRRGSRTGWTRWPARMPAGSSRASRRRRRAAPSSVEPLPSL